MKTSENPNQTENLNKNYLLEQVKQTINDRFEKVKLHVTDTIALFTLLQTLGNQDVASKEARNTYGKGIIEGISILSNESANQLNRLLDEIRMQQELLMLDLEILNKQMLPYATAKVTYKSDIVLEEQKEVE